MKAFSLRRLPFGLRAGPARRPKHGPSVPDINLLPPGLAPRRLSGDETRLLALLALLLSLAVVQAAAVGPRALATGRALLPAGPSDPLQAELESLEDRISDLQAEVRRNEATAREVRDLRVPWGDLLTYVYGTAVPSGVAVEGVRQDGAAVTVAGASVTSAAAAAFGEALSASPAIASVSLRTITHDQSTDAFSFVFDITLTPGAPVEPA